MGHLSVSKGKWKEQKELHLNQWIHNDTHKRKMIENKRFGKENDWKQTFWKGKWLKTNILETGKWGVNIYSPSLI
jgi:hypothetical protein